MDILI